MNERGGDENPKIVYKPTLKETRLVRFCRFVEQRHPVKLENYWDLHKWSVENYPEFWDCVWKFFDIHTFEPYTEVYDKKNDFTNMEWFKGARINYAANVLKYRDSHTAIIECDDYDNVSYITYAQLYEEVKIYREALTENGVRKGDVVGVYMSNKKEAIIAFLATASLGAKLCGSLPLMGVKGALSRFELEQPKVLFTGGNFYFGEEEIKMMDKLPAVVDALPELKKVVFVPSKNKDIVETIDHIPKCVFISDFLEPARRKHDLGDIQFEEVPFDYPLFISFTSGTTGPPKRLIHSHGAFLASVRDFGLHQDNSRKDVMFSISPVGWISWNMSINSLHLGLTLVSYDGYPYDTSPTRFWDLMEKFGVTSSYIWSSVAEEMSIKEYLPKHKHSLKNFRNLMPMGSPTKPEVFDFLAEKVTPGLFFSSVYGCTEVFGQLTGCDSNLPIYKGELQAPALAMDLKVLNEEGEAVVGKRGEVVISNPYPAMPVMVINYKGVSVMDETYLKQYPGHWCVGDDAWINPNTKGIIVYGRSDETMNPKGARFNCSEIYFALEGFPGIKDSVCTSQYNSNFDERVVLFVQMLPGHKFTSNTINKIKETIGEVLTFEHVPDIVMETPDIPYSLTGKKLNGVVKKLINKREILNLQVIFNPTSVDFFKTVELGDF